MRKSIVFFFGKRFLKSKRSLVLPHISVVMSSLAICVSVSILIIVTSVMNGFSKELIGKILGLNSHITIYSSSNTFNDLSKINKRLRSIDGVKLVFPVINGSGMVVNRDESIGIFVKGMQKNDIRNNKDLNQSLITNLDDFNGYSVILGKGVARQIMVKKGDYVNLIVPIVAKTMFGTFPRQVKLKVIGVLSSNSQQYDNYMAIIPFETAKDIFSIKDGASSIEIMTNDPENLKEVESKISKIGKYYISDWKMENSGLLHALKVESNVMSLILGLFVVISVFTIFAVIRMMVKSKERDIAILKAHGISNSEIGKMFFIVGFAICVAGMILGNFLGILFALNVDDIRLFLENILHTTLLDGDIYLLSNLPSKIIVSDIIKINLFTFILSLFCIYFSIKRNTKINVVEILRNN